jgi:hypothetical protein
MNLNHLCHGVAVIALLLTPPQLLAADKAVPSNVVDSIIVDQIAKEFEGDRSRYLRWLRDQNKTQRQYRAEVGAKLADQAKRAEAQKDAGQKK